MSDLSTLSEAKRALLQKYLRGDGERPFHGSTPPSPRDPGSTTPLSFAQYRLWFLDQLEPGSAAYTITTALRLSSALDVSALERALGEIMARHETMRTTFGMKDGEPVQLIGSVPPVTIPIVDLREKEDGERAVERLITEEAERSFDLRTGPLFRAILLTTSACEQVLLLTMHHIITDGWSMGVFFRELAVLYEAFSAGLPSPLAPLPIQYADYAIQQQARLSGSTLERQVTYWREQLAGAPAVLALPTDYPRSQVQRYRGAGLSIRLPKDLTAALQTLGRREGCTLFMTLLAAWQILLARYSGQDDIVVGAPIANRTQVETEGLIGFFVNTLALRTHLSGDPSFTELLARVRETTLGAYAHQDLPFEKLVETLQPERSRSYAPLFQVMLALHNAPATPPRLGKGSTKYIELENSTARFDLTLSLEEQEGALVGRIEYDTALFKRETISRMSGHFATLLAGVTADPSRTISTLPLLTEPERRQLLVEWNDTAASFPADKRLHQLFEEQVTRTPDAPAVIFENTQLSYAELNARANQLAHHLIRLGVGPDHLVGLCVERSLDMVVGVLGILKAGGAYVPLDPSYPRDRLAFMLEDAQVIVLVTQAGARDALPPAAMPVVLMDDASDSLAGESCANPTIQGSGSDLAYVIYTSGSTGKPKGVM
ncbi:MAG: non-ribosomal peptide synthetase, partial [Chloroflexota bacterium]